MYSLITIYNGVHKINVTNISLPQYPVFVANFPQGSQKWWDFKGKGIHCITHIGGL